MTEKENKEREIADKIQEMQLLEQNLQNFLIQKQAFQLELSEIQNALSELNSSGEEVYKVIGQIMLKSNKKDIEKELKDKERVMDLRLKTIEKQEKAFVEKLEKLRDEVLRNIKN